MSAYPGTPEDALRAMAAEPGPAQAVAYLVFESRRIDLAEAELTRIADALGRQPEALLLAGRLLAERAGASPALYLEALAEHVAAAPETPAYSKAYRAAVLTSFEIVEHEPAMRGQAPTSILALSAFLPDDALPVSLLEGAPESYPAEIRPFIADAVLRREALGLLDRLGLIEGDETGRRFTVSKLTKAVVRDLLAEAGETATWERAASALADRAAPPQTGSGRAGPVPPPPAPSSSPPPSREDAIALFEAAEELAGNGHIEDALARHESARVLFARLSEAAPEDLQAQADLAASHGKIGLTHASAGRVREGLEWLATCRFLITELQRREPANDLWPRYLASLDGEIAALGEQEDNSPQATEAMPQPAGADHQDGGTVRRLVRALKSPEGREATAAEHDAVMLVSEDAAGMDDEEPLPLEVDGVRGPPKVFKADSLFAEEAGLVPPAPPAARRSGFLARFFGRRA